MRKIVNDDKIRRELLLSRRSFAAVGTTRLEVHPPCALKSSIVDIFQVKEDFFGLANPQYQSFSRS